MESNGPHTPLSQSRNAKSNTPRVLWAGPPGESPRRTDTCSGALPKVQLNNFPTRGHQRVGGFSRSQAVVGLTEDTEPSETNKLLLHKVCSYNKPKMLEYMLDVLNVDDLNSVDDNGDTALHLCVRNGNIRGCEILCQHGARMDIPNNQNLTALSLAWQGDNEELFALLVEFKQSQVSGDVSVQSRDVGTSQLKKFAHGGDIYISQTPSAGGRSSSAGSSLYGSILNARARPDAPSPAASLTVDGVHLDVSVGFFYTDEASDVCDGGESGPPCSFVYPDGAVVHASPARALGQKPAFHPISPQSAITAGSSTSTMLRHGPYVMTAPDAHGRPAVAAAPADGMKRCKSGSVSRSTSSASSASTRRGDDDDSAPRVGCTGGLRDGLSRIVPGLRSGRATPTSGPLSPAPSSSPPSTPQRPLHANQQLWGERGIREEGGLWDDGAGNALVGPAAGACRAAGGFVRPVAAWRRRRGAWGTRRSLRMHPHATTASEPHNVVLRPGSW
eukprot:CAMPEP_0113677504 /NCGR_PEP_ID=MMETSP0038_2-20120614/9312_1 /TAXON_ID=2898 /ORGANISM="Cryptomonas paramecium" /LENGTH=501 /DNA_ID=CAMNT_0000594805 /DNA_START=352 /DNA_END=1858 /DNA_ORIENTATION=+ /assembly_acc=CAM_ASM_000170